ncbi:hypothetical protein KC207_00490 [Phycicoccus sp. BSK3Z-2]|uniref:Uncharacterized protein n=1 Tax=Phycicoccus avicenniae TaxID=2828860 RepID=A0A941HXE8_9MICO|nr:hypothetical protein [Phycicoccus avicenniae]MBR7741773.1 hypothetical protein [Phycicoccus avicenniae]
MSTWKRVQPLIMLGVSALIVTAGIVGLSEGRTGTGWFQVGGGIALAAIVVYEAKVIEPRRRARDEQRSRR